MAYYNTCSDCGAHLDPGEVCECRQEKEAVYLSIYSSEGENTKKR